MKRKGRGRGGREQRGALQGARSPSFMCHANHPLVAYATQTYSKITRFCLVCNYVTRIIEPLASRCAKFRFRPLSREVMEARLRAIGAAEGASVTQEMMDAILTVADGCVLTFFPSPSFPPCLPPSPSSLSGGFPLVPPRRFIS